MFVPKSYDERISIAGHSYDVWKAGEKGKSRFDLRDPDGPPERAVGHLIGSIQLYLLLIIAMMSLTIVLATARLLRKRK